MVDSKDIKMTTENKEKPVFPTDAGTKEFAVT